MKKSAIFAKIDVSDEGNREFESLFGHEKSAKLAPEGAFLPLERFCGAKNGVSFKKYRQECMAKRKLKLFKEPKIIRNKSGDWYIQYYFRDPDNPLKWIAKKERCGINYIKDPSEKEKEAEQLRLEVLDWLNKGNNPFTEDGGAEHLISRKESDVEEIKQTSSIWTIGKAISEYNKYVLSQGFSATTIRSYRKYTKAFKEWVTDHNLLHQKACLFTEMDVQEYLEDLYKKNEWSTRTFNNYLEFMATFFVQCIRLEKQETRNRSLKYDFEPQGLKSKKTTPQRNKAFTPVLYEKIKKELSRTGYENLRDYCEWITLSSMRPAEIRELKIVDIDEINRQIRIKGKTGDRLVPISDQLLNLIHRRNLAGKDVNSYVFGYMGNVDLRRMSVAYFLEQFAVIKRLLNLDWRYGPYSFKPTGIIMMIKAGIPDKDIMDLTGHKTESAFAAYKRDLVLENSSIMKGKTIDF